MSRTEKYYIAYGSNLNIEQMAYRCPNARPLWSGMLRDYELFYAGSRSGNYATIRKQNGCSVPIGVWAISEEDEEALDRYEGYPVFYYKKEIGFKIDGEQKTAIVYIMRQDAIEGQPTRWYEAVVRQGYRDFGLDEKYLDASLKQYRRAV